MSDDDAKAMPWRRLPSMGTGTAGFGLEWEPWSKGGCVWSLMALHVHVTHV